MQKELREESQSGGLFLTPKTRWQPWMGFEWKNGRKTIGSYPKYGGFMGRPAD